MAFKQTLEAFELLDSAIVTGEQVARVLESRGLAVELVKVEETGGSTDFIKVVVPGSSGASSGGEAPTLGIIGRLGGIGTRPARIGVVSDADGAIAALAVASKIADMARRGDVLPGDVIIATHICPSAPIMPHEPVPFMGSPVEMETMNRIEVDPGVHAVLSIDATKGNRVINHKGIAVSPTVKEGYILGVSEDLLDILQVVTGRPPVVLPVTTLDITPYGNGLYHLNSIMQPAVATDAPVVGLAITSEVAVPGCATGANHLGDIEMAARFAVEVAKEFGAGRCQFYKEEEFNRVLGLYGSMKHLQTRGG